MNIIIQEFSHGGRISELAGTLTMRHSAGLNMWFITHVHLVPPFHCLPFELTIHSAFTKPRSWFSDGPYQTTAKITGNLEIKKTTGLICQISVTVSFSSFGKTGNKNVRLDLKKITMLCVLPPSFKPVNNLICCKTDMMWVAIRAISIFNWFCSNVARRVALFCCPFYLHLRYISFPGKWHLFKPLEPLTNFDTRDLQIHPYTIYMNEFTDVNGLIGLGWLLWTMNEKGNKKKKSYIVT